MTWDVAATLLIVFAAAWLLRWRWARDAACSKCPVPAQVDRLHAAREVQAACCRPARVSLGQLTIGRSARIADASASSAEPPVNCTSSAAISAARKFGPGA